MTNWSSYPNFVNREMLSSGYRNSTIDVYKFRDETKQLCQIEDKYFDIEDERAVYNIEVKWVPGSTIYIKFLDGDEWQKMWTQKIVMEEIVPKLPENIKLQFVEPNEYADVKITFKFDGYGSSLIGTRCKSVGQNSPTMKIGVCDFPKSRTFVYNNKTYIIPQDVPEPINNTGTIFKHEFGHVFGLYHEHQNPINNPIQWDVPKVLKYYMNPPDPWNKQDIINNVIDKLPVNITDATPFDPLSIMMYTIDPSLTLNNIGFVKNDDYSQSDLDWLKNRMLGTYKPPFYKKYKWFLIGFGIIALALISYWLIVYKKK